MGLTKLICVVPRLLKFSSTRLKVYTCKFFYSNLLLITMKSLSALSLRVRTESQMAHHVSCSESRSRK